MLKAAFIFLLFMLCAAQTTCADDGAALPVRLDGVTVKDFSPEELEKIAADE